MYIYIFCLFDNYPFMIPGFHLGHARQSRKMTNLKAIQKLATELRTVGRWNTLQGTNPYHIPPNGKFGTSSSTQNTFGKGDMLVPRLYNPLLYNRDHMGPTTPFSSQLPAILWILQCKICPGFTPKLELNTLEN